jgi:5-oxoprolinase (ATP-hydrolysing) subunit C
MLELLEPGLLTLVQGIPYRSQRHLGMPLAGPADPVASALANWLVGNDPDAAALETAYAPVKLLARAACIVAVQGAAVEIELDGKRHSTDRSVHLLAGQELTIPAPQGGCRSYIAINGGIAVAPVLGATSTYIPAKIGGLAGSVLAGGAIIPVHGGKPIAQRSMPDKFRLRYGEDFLLRITLAPESDWIDPSSLSDQIWTIGRRADRIGLELEGSSLKLLRVDQLESSAVFPGTIQCPPSGLPFLLGPDAQTTGGYPRIAQVIRADRHLIGQLRPGARVRFQRIKPAEVQCLYRSKIALIGQLQPEIRLD